MKIRRNDGRCEQYVFDQELKAQMKQDRESHDGMRRCDHRAKCYSKKQDLWLCVYHYYRR